MHLLRNNLIILASLLVIGCATTEPGIKTVIQTVDVPVAIPCKTPIPVVPNFNFDKLTTDKDIFTKSQATLADRDLHLDYETELLAALKSCE
jgi:hypothetical protein